MPSPGVTAKNDQSNEMSNPKPEEEPVVQFKEKGPSDEEIDERRQQTGTQGGKGSGFGLHRCDDFFARHGGHLTWASSPGKGSTFSFTIRSFSDNRYG